MKITSHEIEATIQAAADVADRYPEENDRNAIAALIGIVRTFLAHEQVEII